MSCGFKTELDFHVPIIFLMSRKQIMDARARIFIIDDQSPDKQ